MAPKMVVLLVLACLVATASAGCFSPLPTLMSTKTFTAESLLGKISISKGGSLVPAGNVCPGFTYDINVQFPDARNYFTTITKGFFQGLLPSCSCPNQLTNDQAAPVSSLDLQFSVSCTVTGSAVLSIASLPASTSMYKWFNYSIPLLPLSNTTCFGSPCNLAYLSTGVMRVVPAYGQCGGAGGECSKYYCDDKAYPGVMCTSGWSCMRQTRWYYQCLPSGTTTTAPTTTTPTTVVNGSSIPAYGQCGGAGGVCTQFSACADAAFSGYTCASGTTCQRQQLYFWQCLPAASATPTITPPATSAGGILPFAQCGGSGGICAVYSACADAAFPNYGCPSGFACQRQSEYFHQCLPSGALITTNGTTTPSTGVIALDSYFGSTWVTITKSLGLYCTNSTSGLISFMLNPLGVPKIIDPLALLNVFAGLVQWKVAAISKLDPFSLLTSMKQLCALVPQTNSTESVLVSGMGKFLTVMVDKVLPACNDTAIPAAAVEVLGALGVAATAGGFDVTKAFSLEGMLSVITSFGKLLALVKLFKLL